MALSVFWFRRDLRLEDNTALMRAMESGNSVLPVFIFDTNLLEGLPKDDARVSFIYDVLADIHQKLQKHGKNILVFLGEPIWVWKRITELFPVEAVYANRDYEPYATQRDSQIQNLLAQQNIAFHLFKDQVIFEESEVTKKDGKPYTIFTPYMKQWLKQLSSTTLASENEPDYSRFYNAPSQFPSLSEIGFSPSSIRVPSYDLALVEDYAATRDYPAKKTTHLGPHLRFGTVSIRKLIKDLKPSDAIFLSELIWREFFMQIIHHFPRVIDSNFNQKYDSIQWRNNKEEFNQWMDGMTGYPLVDAGMRQMNATGFMHNRVRMVTASFLCKHLLIDWKWGEAYFAEKLLDYELSSNNGNWQWAAGTGCDAAPYFRIFNPTAQMKKFDKNLEYVKKWVPEFGTPSYPKPMVEHEFARKRALEVYERQ